MFMQCFFAPTIVSARTCPINSDGHSTNRQVMGEPYQPVAKEHRDEPWTSSSQQGTYKKTVR
jgi:hypothetical protein